MATFMAVAAVVIQPEPFHVGAGETYEGHWVTAADEKPGNDEVIRRWTPDPKSDVDPPDQCRLTVVPGTTAKDESKNNGFPRAVSCLSTELPEGALEATVGGSSTVMRMTKAMAAQKGRPTSVLHLTPNPPASLSPKGSIYPIAGPMSPAGVRTQGGIRTLAYEIRSHPVGPRQPWSSR